MTIPEPPPPQPPATVGTQPRSADDVNNLVGLHLRTFCAAKVTIGQDQEWLAVTDLQAAPYYFTPEQEALIKSAIADLDASLDAVNMTFISRLVGMI